MSWININKEAPKYYEVVKAKLTTGEIVPVWRASNGVVDVYTNDLTDQIYYANEIKEWEKYED